MGSQRSELNGHDGGDALHLRPQDVLRQEVCQSPRAGARNSTRVRDRDRRGNETTVGENKEVDRVPGDRILIAIGEADGGRGGKRCVDHADLAVA